jgi:hydrogenase nickel incorporation protein HypB
MTCGCGQGTKVRIEGDPNGEHVHVLADGTRVVHSHDHDAHEHEHADGATHSHEHVHHHSHDDAHSHEHGHEHEDVLRGGRAADTELIRLEKSLIDKNQRIAERNRGWLAGRGVAALNLMSSPGAGKTSLLVRTLTDLAGEMPMAVIEGDQETSADADRIRATGASAIQINTGAGCHLEADMLERALQRLSPPSGSVLFIENVGNLVCPSLFDLGENLRVVVLSVTEGEDKPLKYPHMFRFADLMLLTKTDLLPHLRFDADRAEANARATNPLIRCLRVSIESGDGLDDWYAALRALRSTAPKETQA